MRWIPLLTLCVYTMYAVDVKCGCVYVSLGELYHISKHGNWESSVCYILHLVCDIDTGPAVAARM